MQHQPLLTTYTADEIDSPVGKILADIRAVVFSGLRVQQVDAGRVRLAPADGHNAAHGAHVGGGEEVTEVLPVNQVGQFVQQRVMAADDYQGVFQALLSGQKADADFFAGVIALGTLGDLDHAVGLHKGGYHTAAARQRGRHQPVAYITHTHAYVFLIFEPGNNRPCECRPGTAAAVRFPPVPEIDQRTQQLVDDDDAGNRIAGYAQNRHCSLIPEDGGFAGFDGNTVIKHLADLADGSGGIIVPPGGGTGVQDHQVAFRDGFFEHSPDLVIPVGNDWIGSGLRAPGGEHGGKDGRVKLHNVARFRVRTGRNDLIPRGDDTHHGLCQNLHFQNTAGDHGADSGGCDLHQSRQNHLPGADILADLADVLPRRGGGVDGDGTVLVPDDLLHHDNCIAAFRDGVAGIDNRKLPLPQGDGRGFSGTEAVLCK